MIHVPTVMEFWERTAIYVDYEFGDVPLIPDSVCGFNADRLKELVKFCKKNKDYHIVSLVKGCLYFNKVVEAASTFHLAEGDSNPDLVCFQDYKVAHVLEKHSSGKTKVSP